MYNPVLYDHVDEDLYVFKSFGKSLKRSRHFTHRSRSELIIWNKLIDEAELVRDLNIGQDIDVLSVNLSSRFFNITGILSANEESRVLCLISNFA